jgi:predicted ribosome quality control (RQC) complex YloA/Tae2 family protein
MIAHYFTLEALARQMRAGFAGSTIDEVFTQSKNELIITLTAPGRGERSLLVSIAPGMNAFFFRDGRMRARKNSTDIFPEIFGSEVSDIRVDPFSRVPTLCAGGYRLKAHLFNNTTANVFLLGPGDVVVSAFTDAAAFSGRAYAVAHRDDELADPGDSVRIADRLGASDGPLDGAVKKMFPWLGPLYLREALFRAGLEGESAARDAVGDAARGLSSAIAGMLGETGDPRGWIYAAPGFDGEIVSAVALRHLRGGVTPRPARDLNDAVREIYSTRRRDAGLEGEKSELLEAAGRELRRVERSLKEAKARAEDRSAPERHRAAGSLILTHLNEIRKGDTEARLRDDAGAEVVVRLDRTLTPAGNANAFFDRARKAETALAENETRIAVLEGKLAGIEKLIAEIGECADERALRDLKRTLRPGNRAPIDMPGGERLPYRVFPIGTQYEAWVGKSSSDNDTLTFRHAGPHDYWMHVRGSSGSHVVLRSVSGGRFDPPKDVLRAAAKIAAYYSKMKKAGMVPVAWCERKYVKKPKNAPPGTVTMQREEVIFVEPGLP